MSEHNVPFKCIRDWGGMEKIERWRCSQEAEVTNSGESLITSNVVIGNGDLSLRSQARAKLYFKSIKPYLRSMICFQQAATQGSG